MKNKTCGECKHYFSCEAAYEGNAICDDFKAVAPLTNGDKIRQMSNEELAKLFILKVMICNGCSGKGALQIKDNPSGANIFDEVCAKKTEAWLNAPADCVGKDTNVPTNAPDTNVGKMEDGK